MNVVDEIKELVEVKIVINEEALADKLFEQAIDPLMLKLVDLIPTEFDNLFYAGKKAELKEYFRSLVVKGVDELEEKVGMDLDGKEE